MYSCAAGIGIANWIIIFILFLYICSKNGFGSGIFYLCISIVVGKIMNYIYDILSQRFIEKANELDDSNELTVSEKIEWVRKRGSIFLIVTILAAIIAPWVLAGFFLGWFNR